ncbi:MAG: serine hydrolase [Verrucomicrobia bacterium]|nr:serine hydrolase [Verrucomicrobiota bacterium]
MASALAAGLAGPAGSLPRSAPEAQGVSSAGLLRFLDAAEEKIHSLHSFMLVRHGHVVAEGWWAPYAAEEPHQLFSLSKSFTSTAVGLAVAEGKLSVDDPVLGFFPDEAPEKPSANLRAMRVRDLLTMSTGHHDEDIRGFPYNSDESLVRKFLALPVAHKPGTFFVYNTPGSFMLSAIVQKVTGETVLDYLRPRLFAPLGIADPTWEASKQGVSLGGFGLNLRTEDIARFGQLYLQKGRWQGKQLVSEVWVEAATARQMSNGSSPASDWEQGYGYQFWRCRYGIFRGDGAHGQFCVVLPQFDAVVAMTAGTRDLQGVLVQLWEHLLPALAAAPLLADPAAQTRLASRLAQLSLPTQRAGAVPQLAASLAGRRYEFSANPLGLEAIAIDAADGPDGVATLAFKLAGNEGRVTAGPGKWRKGTLGGVPVAVSGAWTGADTYTLEIVRYRTPFSNVHRLRFAGDELHFDIAPNVGPAPKPATLVGKRK